MDFNLCIRTRLSLQIEVLERKKKTKKKKQKKKKQNDSVDPDESACYEPSHLALDFL